MLGERAVIDLIGDEGFAAVVCSDRLMPRFNNVSQRRPLRAQRLLPSRLLHEQVPTRASHAQAPALETRASSGSDGFALVLGAGGERAVPWQIGVLAGLADGGIDPCAAKAILGTSAGALVGARIARGEDPRRSAKRLAEADRKPAPSVAPEAATALETLGALWRSSVGLELTERRHLLAAAARSAQTLPAEAWIAEAGARLREVPDWPRSLFVVATDGERGERVTLTSRSRVELARALAAARAIPIVLPPIEIGGRMHFDGALGSATNADLLPCASGLVFIVSPTARAASGETFEAEWASALEREVATLRAGGVEVIVLSPGESESEAMGDDLLGLGNPRASVTLGRRRGIAAAQAIR
jgi:NTE family protein